eukprot:CAMPEP_0182421368 /NCGR_PEP_ID=MMETSP1167-20130531/6732_1 /TAXON_ID=2988 /ORGANISM="Mallomonas Sp, Strain CCMP3275" /LENGTH=528 /DNA_ID=CAMNT_0024598435 /DNA_START=39 /DNA_END=1625 /DNA_ORIENTATION=+
MQTFFVSFFLLLHSISLKAFRFTRNNHLSRRHTLLAVTDEKLSQGVSSTDERITQVFSKQAKLLEELWTCIANPEEDFTSIDFRLKDYDLSRHDVRGMLQHFQFCKDCSGDSAFLMATQDTDKNDVLRLSQISFPIFNQENDDFSEGEDPMAGIDWSEDDKDDELAPIFPIQPDDELLLTDTKEWVRAVIADFGVCPFTMDPQRAGIPMGGVRYTISRTIEPEGAFESFWKEVSYMLSSTEKECSTVLLVFPEIQLFGNYELFEAYCDSLSDALCGSTMCFEDQLQLVFFHPKYQFRDGQARTGIDKGAANFARRSPWPMINILRTPQVRAAQKGIPTGTVYQQNEERLSEIGTETLERMLYTRNWTDLPVHTTKAKLLRSKLKEYEAQQASKGEREREKESDDIPDIAECPFVSPSLSSSPSLSLSSSSSVISNGKEKEKEREKEREREITTSGGCPAPFSTGEKEREKERERETVKVNMGERLVDMLREREREKEEEKREAVMKYAEAVELWLEEMERERERERNE